MYLEVEVHALLQVEVLREAVVLLHVVGHGEVAVCAVTLGQEDGVVEADLLVAGDALFVKYVCLN